MGERYIIVTQRSGNLGADKKQGSKYLRAGALHILRLKTTKCLCEEIMTVPGKQQYISGLTYFEA